jgi:hypothetical protein
VHDLRTIQTYAFTYAYGVTNDLMLVASLPYVRRTGIREAHEEDDEFEVENLGPTDGIGDTTLLGQYRFFKGRGMETAVLLGFKAPTGKTNERSLEGETFDAEFQPGSGSWDGLLGIALTQRTGSLSFDANVLYTLVTEGTQETDLGDLLQYNVAISYRLASLGGSAQPMFNGACTIMPIKRMGCLPSTSCWNSTASGALSKRLVGLRTETRAAIPYSLHQECASRSINGPASSLLGFRLWTTSTEFSRNRIGASRRALHGHSSLRWS